MGGMELTWTYIVRLCTAVDMRPIPYIIVIREHETGIKVLLAVSVSAYKEHYWIQSNDTAVGYDICQCSCTTTTALASGVY
jgi:hypothetical protein